MIFAAPAHLQTAVGIGLFVFFSLFLSLSLFLDAKYLKLIDLRGGISSLIC